MDDERFDALTRSVIVGAGTRRALLRLLTGSALGTVAARLGLGGTAEAKAKQHRSKSKPKRTSRAERTAHGRLQAEGKRKGKKHNHKPPQDPPCGLDSYRCPDGTCVPWGTCCAGEKRCANKTCVPFNDCCPDEKRCSQDDVICIPKIECCDTPVPLCRPCEEAVCESGKLVCRATAGLDACQQCPKGGAVCPNVGGVGRWSLPDGGFIDLPDGCCPTQFLQADQTTGQPFCNSAQSFIRCEYF